MNWVVEHTSQRMIRNQAFQEFIVEWVINHPWIQRPLFVYQGMSGIAITQPLSLELHKRNFPHGLAYVRKEGEINHPGRQAPIELAYCITQYDPVNRWEYLRRHYIPVFVDRYCFRGETLYRCWEAINKKVSWLDEEWMGLTWDRQYKHIRKCTILSEGDPACASFVHQRKWTTNFFI